MSRGFSSKRGRALGVEQLETRSLLANASPFAPTINEPTLAAASLNPEDVHMEAGPFVDPDAGDVHTATEWEIWSVGGVADRVWHSLQIGTIEVAHIHLGDGDFENSHAGLSSLLPESAYQLRVRFRDSSGDPATEWSPLSTRDFATGPLSHPFPLEIDDILAIPSPSWLDTENFAVVLPSGAPSSSLTLEGEAGDLLLRFSGLNGLVNHVANPVALPEHVHVRVRIDAGATGNPLILDETNLSFTDGAGRNHTIYLPGLALASGEEALFWVGADGSTYVALPEQTAPDFSQLARGAVVPWSAPPGYRVEIVATGFQLPVNIAFVPNPGTNADDPFYYVTELYGTIKVVSRDGSVGTYASGLLNFDPTGDFPGSGEQGLGGIAVDPLSGDLFVSMVTDSDGLLGGDHHPIVMRLQRVDGGKTAASQSIILDMPGELQGQSHFISNVTIGPQDGKLYVHNGDGLSPAAALDLDAYRGKILRMNLDGTPVSGNPFYDLADGVNARDYVFAYGVRNPFGGAWRDLDGKHYEVEAGPTVDRLARIDWGDNFGWDGTDASMAIDAIYNWNASGVAPVNLAFIQASSFGGSHFPASKQDHLFVTQSGSTYGTGPQIYGKVITEFVLDANAGLVSGPTDFVRYQGSGKATALGLDAGPDGLYFTDLYKDQGAVTPIDAGANVLRIRYVGLPDFEADTTVGAPPLTVQFMTGPTCRAQRPISGTLATGPRAHFNIPHTPTRKKGCTRLR